MKFQNIMTKIVHLLLLCFVSLLISGFSLCSTVSLFWHLCFWLAIKRYFEKMTHFRKWYYFLLANTLNYVYNILLRRYSCMHVIEQYTVYPWSTLVLQFSFISSYSCLNLILLKMEQVLWRHGRLKYKSKKKMGWNSYYNNVCGMNM